MWSFAPFLLFIGLTLGQQRSLSGSSSRFRGNRLIAGRPESKDFNCPDDFGFYHHPDDCSKYYVCVFGGALLETCTGGLMYSNELRTCDWPRNVVCAAKNREINPRKIIDTRTQAPPTDETANDVLAGFPSSISRGLDNTISKTSNRRNKVRQDNQPRRGRLLTRESNPNQEISSFQAQESASRAFNVVPGSDAKISFPVIPPIPTSNQIHTPKAASVNINNDPFLSNATDADYFYYYDYLDEADFLEPTTPKPRRVTPSRISRPSKPSTTVKGASPQVSGRTPQRPNPQYPQPPVDVPATNCDPNVCRLPDCFCGDKRIPGGLKPQNVPQLVLLTFDDSVNDLNKKLYQDLFEVGRTNPNGCPIAATFYISHEWTDYSQVQNLYADGHEIASHSITHSFGEQFSTLKWAKEIAGQREIMSAYGGVRMEDIRGMRAPFLSIGGDRMFRMLYEQNFTYDSSMPVYQANPPSYPYTLDYKLFHQCMIAPCPKNSFPGVWEVPMVMWTDLNGGRCSMVDACSAPPDARGIYDMLVKNFERHYTTNRAPLGLYFHAAWFTTPHHKEGFIAFLDTISAMDDVWLTTTYQAVQWTRNPVSLSQAKSFKPFGCSYPERPPRCSSTKVCNVRHRGSVRYMKTCQKCPANYPWTGNTGVQSSLNDV